MHEKGSARHVWRRIKDIITKPFLVQDQRPDKVSTDSLIRAGPSFEVRGKNKLNRHSLGTNSSTKMSAIVGHLGFLQYSPGMNRNRELASTGVSYLGGPSRPPSILQPKPRPENRQTFFSLPLLHIPRKMGSLGNPERTAPGKLSWVQFIPSHNVIVE